MRNFTKPLAVKLGSSKQPRAVFNKNLIGVPDNGRLPEMLKLFYFSWNQTNSVISRAIISRLAFKKSKNKQKGNMIIYMEIDENYSYLGPREGEQWRGWCLSH